MKLSIWGCTFVVLGSAIYNHEPAIALSAGIRLIIMADTDYKRKFCLNCSSDFLLTGWINHDERKLVSF